MLEEVGARFVGEAIGQKLAGAASASGTLTGNATELVTTGKVQVQGLSAIDRVTVDAGDATFRVVLPELDGRLLTRAVSFKAESPLDPDLEFSTTRHEPLADRVDYVARLAREAHASAVADKRKTIMDSDIEQARAKLG